MLLFGNTYSFPAMSSDQQRASGGPLSALMAGINEMALLHHPQWVRSKEKRPLWVLKCEAVIGRAGPYPQLEPPRAILLFTPHLSLVI